MITYFQAIVVGLLQGITELFPISSLGHSVLLPTLFGWHSVVTAQSQKESYFLAFLVGLHVATALALLTYYRQEWIRIVKGLFRSLGKHKIESSDEKLAWLIVVASIPAGIIGLLLEHFLRTIFAKPLYAAIFLVANGLILFWGEHLRKQSSIKRDFSIQQTTQNLKKMKFTDAVIIGFMQTLALLAGISRSGITMVGGLWRGLDHEDAARFSFLLATPIILAAGVYKLPDLLGVNGNGVHGQILAGSIAAAVAAYLTVRFLDRFFQKNTLRPFAIYSIVFGIFMIAVIH